MRMILSTFLSLLASIGTAAAQATVPGTAMVDVHVPSIAQPLLPVWYNLIYLSAVVVAIFFVFVLVRTIKDKTYLH